jgi:di/tricarboxylate transporter
MYAFYVLHSCVYREGRESSGENLKTMLMLAVAYSSNLGGCGTLTGTTPNLILQDLIKR